MKTIMKIMAVTGLMLTIVPAILVFNGVLDWQTHATLMFVGMILWFASAPSVMKKKA